MLPFIQTRPPRALETSHPWSSRLRGLNLSILDHASIRHEHRPERPCRRSARRRPARFPAPPAVVATMFVAAAAVSAGAVLGRYHYSIDIIAGWVSAARLGCGLVWLRALLSAPTASSRHDCRRRSHAPFCGHPGRRPTMLAVRCSPRFPVRYVAHDQPLSSVIGGPGARRACGGAWRAAARYRSKGRRTAAPTRARGRSRRS